ncbi:MAG: ABC transporter permease [Saprospiraceae bacterium]|nr:ABC transporter permease [Saprospiraceae bacterium]
MLLKQAIRTLTKNRFYALLNIGGLTLAGICLVFIYQYVRFEYSYDQFHEESSRIYRAATFYGDRSSASEGDAMNAAPFGPAVKEDLPAVEDFVRLTPEYGRLVFQYRDHQFEEEKVYYTDNSFFEVFGYRLMAGNATTALLEPQSVVLSLRSAERYFGRRDQWAETPVGKTLQVDSKSDLKVTGVLEEIPENTHLKFDALVSFPTFLTAVGDPSQEWHWNDFYTYLKVAPGVTEEVLQNQLDDFALRQHADDGPGLQKTYYAQPIEHIHLGPAMPYESEPGGNKAALRILFLIGVFIVLIAWANYVNLATAKARDRLQEVGLRKVLGASKGNLLSQFLIETLVLNAIAGGMAFILIHLSQPLVNNLVGHELNALPGSSISIVLLLVGAMVVGTLVAGLYPAYALLRSTARQSIVVDNGKVEWLRKGLVIFQYGASIVLIVCSMVILKQLHFMQSMDLGFAAEQKLILKAPTEIIDSIERSLFRTFRSEALQSSAIEGVAASSAIPGKYHLDLNVWGGVALEGSNEEDYASVTNYQVDDSYMDVFGLEIIAGEAFSHDLVSDDGDLAISESALATLGLSNAQDAIGRKVRFGSDTNVPTIRSVFKDYHHRSPRHAMEPLMLWNDYGNILYYTVQLGQVNRAELPRVISELEQTWRKVAPNTPFQYFFFDDQFNQQYEADQRLARIVLILSVLAIMIACLGLFGLTSYMIAVKRKEIGIRKVLGATVENVVKGLSVRYLKLVAAACIIGIPVALQLSKNWLDGFAFRTSIGAGMLCMSAIITLVIAMATVSSLTIRAALQNPAKVIGE